MGASKTTKFTKILVPKVLGYTVCMLMDRAGRYQKNEDDTIFILSFTILLNITILQ